jgi:hypothetical protein
MARETNVPYHQNVYDLLDLAPGVCPVASRMIADHEAEFGPLPASVREWYCVPNMVPTESDEWDRQEGTLWYEYSNADPSMPLADVLVRVSMISRFPQLSADAPSSLAVKFEHRGDLRWWLELDGSDDPPVLAQDQPEDLNHYRVAAEFSEFVWRWIQHHHGRVFTPLSTRQDWDPSKPPQNRPPKPNETTHWLCAPATPYPVPVIDFLTDTLGEPTLRPVNALVTQFTFTSADGLIRLTTDHLDHPNPHAAWWVAGHTPEAFERLRELLTPWNCFGPVVRTSGDAGR